MKTVFVVGAGASTELDLPLGNVLVSEIRELVKAGFFSKHPHAIEDGPLARAALALNGIKMDVWVEAAKCLYGGLLNAGSIDQFLHTHRSNTEVQLLGKIAIICSILEGEKRCVVRNIGDKKDYLAAANAAAVTMQKWIGRLYQLYSFEKSPADLRDAFSNIAFVTFNYDRCIQYFLYHLLRIVGHVRHEETREIISSIPILHAYGSLGAIPELHDGDALAFGETKADAQKIAGQVKTFREEDTLTAPQVEEIRAVVRNAQRIVFLGFSFAPENLAMLFPSQNPVQADVFATTYMLSEQRLKEAKRVIFRASKITDQFAANQCSDFMLKYGDMILSDKVRNTSFNAIPIHAFDTGE